MAKKTGWEKVKKNFVWPGGDWKTKYAPWTRSDKKGTEGPRGLTPPGALWILSADSFYYGAFYMLTQLTLNLEGQGRPTASKTNCWTWELDPAEGAVGWVDITKKDLAGDVNMLYSTSNAQWSTCMGLPWMAKQLNIGKQTVTYPEYLAERCKKDNDPECDLKKPGPGPAWIGGATSSNRFENLADQPYVFAVVMDAQGYWTYRFQPDKDGKTGWEGIEQYKANKVLAAKPKKITDKNGLKTDVPGDVKESVILMPGLSNEAACNRAKPEPPLDPQHKEDASKFSASALGAMATELGPTGPKGKFHGAHNFWHHFSTTGQYQDYPVSVAGVEKPNPDPTKYPCNTKAALGSDCKCKLKRSADLTTNNITEEYGEYI